MAFPTETVYGLGANALDADAVRKVYSAKGRPSDNPTIVHIADAKDLAKLTTGLSKIAMILIENFWPGPLTIVVKKKKTVPYETTGGLETVAVRMPADVTALELIKKAKRPIAAPSANLSGKPSPTKASHVIEDLNGRVDAIIAGGSCRVGIESTVVDVTGEMPVILRPGIITEENIRAVTKGKVDYDPSLLMKEEPVSAPRSPGMKYKHYAPSAEMTVVEGRHDRVVKEIERIKKINESAGRKVGVILFDEDAYKEAAHDFFARLRELDNNESDLILAGALSDTDGVGFAVMNRMLKSAGYNIIKV